MILRRRRGAVLPRGAVPFVIALAGVAALAAAFLAGRRTAGPSEAAYQQLTFRRGQVHSARFTPAGDTIVYSASWEGKPVQLFQSRPESPEFRTLEPSHANVLGITPRGDMALMILEGRAFARGTLARVPLAGGAPRPLAEDVVHERQGPLRGREEAPLLRGRRGRRCRLRDLHPRAGRIAGGAARGRQGHGSFAGRRLGAGHPPRTHAAAAPCPAHGGGGAA